MLPGNVRSAPSGALGFDSDTVITSSVAQQFAQQGYQFCVRYLSLTAGQDPGDLSAAEADSILSVGLALIPVQHVRSPGWTPSGSLGQQDGTNAASNALSIGFPQGVNVWCDVEGVSSSATAQQVIDYCNSWFSAISRRLHSRLVRGIRLALERPAAL